MLTDEPALARTIKSAEKLKIKLTDLEIELHLLRKQHNAVCEMLNHTESNPELAEKHYLLLQNALIELSAFYNRSNSEQPDEE